MKPDASEVWQRAERQGVAKAGRVRAVSDPEDKILKMVAREQPCMLGYLNYKLASVE
jgi:hypothetical protein